MLLLVFLLTGILPCKAIEPGVLFSDVPADDWRYESIQTCCKKGLLDEQSSGVFAPDEPLVKADLVRLLARLYNLSQGGDGSIPEVPETLDDFIRFFDAEGHLFCDLASGYTLDFIQSDPQKLTVLFYGEPLLQENLTIAIGFPGDRTACTASGIREGYDTEYENTKYMFTFPEDMNIQAFDLENFCEDRIRWQFDWKLYAEEGWDDPTPYDALLYLKYREAVPLPLCFRTLTLDDFIYEAVWRMELAVPLSALCEGLPDVRTVDSIPDLPNWRFGEEETQAVLSLYRKGILTGFSEQGAFGGIEWLTRGQAAVIAARFLDAIQG